MNLADTRRRADAAAAARRRGLARRRPPRTHARVRGLPRARPGARRRAAPLRGGVPFDRFAAGSSGPRAAPRRGRGPGAQSTCVIDGADAGGGAAACADVRWSAEPPNRPGNRIKGGGAGISCASRAPTGRAARGVDATEALAPGERVRIGYQSGGHRYLLSLSIDDRGEVTPLYPERGPSLPVPTAGARDAFPARQHRVHRQGTERVVVMLSDQPIDVEAARRAARAAFERGGGDITRLASWTCRASSSTARSPSPELHACCAPH